jgi:hypothetical protein
MTQRLSMTYVHLVEHCAATARAPEGWSAMSADECCELDGHLSATAP